MQKHALIFGGAGFIGSHLSQSLVESGEYARVICIDIQPPRWRTEGVEYREMDVRKPISVDAFEGEISEIYNFAAVHTTPGHEDWVYYWTNVLGATHVCDFARAKGVNKVVFTSSIAVYGPSEEMLDENSELRPESAYGKSKFCAEQIHHQWQHEAPDTRKLVIVRPAVIYGYKEYGNFTRMSKMLSKGRFAFPGRKDTIKSCGYVKDLVRSMAFMIGQDSNSITYNFAYPDRYSAEDITKAFVEVGGYKDVTYTLPLPMMLAVGLGFEILNAVGFTTSINRARVMKLNKSTNIIPKVLVDSGFSYQFDLKSSLQDWTSSSTESDFD